VFATQPQTRCRGARVHSRQATCNYVRRLLRQLLLGVGEPVARRCLAWDTHHLASAGRRGRRDSTLAIRSASAGVQRDARITRYVAAGARRRRTAAGGAASQSVGAPPASAQAESRLGVQSGTLRECSAEFRTDGARGGDRAAAPVDPAGPTARVGQPRRAASVTPGGLRHEYENENKSVGPLILNCE